MKQTLSDALVARGYTTLTAVQEAVTNPDTLGRDLLVSAQTGSGKTVGFGLAIAPRLLGDADTFDAAAAPLALVIAPTRELALQVKRELQWLFAGAGAVVASTVGGMDMRDERRALDRGAHIVVATPGRLRDHIMRGSIDLSALRAVVLDEADEMLDLGFREDLEFILEKAPEGRQTLMFSATVPAAIAKLAQTYQTDALRIAATASAAQHADIAYRALRVAAQDAENGIVNVLRFYEAPNAIVFCNTRATVNRLTTRLSNRGFSVVALSGELSQAERTHALQAMRDGRARVCVATDVAARGIDLPNLELVIHAELPTNAEILLHRSGRTGRAGRKGVSALIVPPAARKKAERLLGGARVHADWDAAPGAEAVTEQDAARMLGDPAWHEAVAESDRATVDLLTGAFTPEQIAAAYLRLWHERHSAPEELSDAGDKGKPRDTFGPSVWFSLAGGRAANAEPRRLLPMLCTLGNLTREDIGAIRIRPEETLIEVRSLAADRFVAAVGPAMTLENGAALVRLDGVPQIDAAPDRAGPPDMAPKARAPKARAPRPEGQATRAGAPPVAAPVAAPAAAPPERPERPRPAKEAWKPRPKPPGMSPVKPAAKPYKKPDPEKAPPTREAPQPAAASKPRRAGAADTSAPYHPDGSDARPRGPRPPVGKPSSKKNRARSFGGPKPTGKSPGKSGGKPFVRPAGPGSAPGKPRKAGRGRGQALIAPAPSAPQAPARCAASAACRAARSARAASAAPVAVAMASSVSTSCSRKRS